MARLKPVNPTRFKSRVISWLLERLPALQPWPKDTHGLYTKPPSGSGVKEVIWHRLEDHTRTLTHPTRITRKGRQRVPDQQVDPWLSRCRCRPPEPQLFGGSVRWIGEDSKQYYHARDVILEYLDELLDKTSLDLSLRRELQNLIELNASGENDRKAR